MNARHDTLDAPRFAVIGNPVAHSKSPQIHAQFAQITGHPVRYGKLLAPVGGFAQTVAAMRAAGMRGANVTVPFKFEAHALCDVLSERARAAGAVNTLSFTHNGIEGDNTDGAGLVSDLVRLSGSLAGKRVLVLGAGGAAAGVMRPLLDALPASLTVLNRTAHKAIELIDALRADCNRTHSPGPAAGATTWPASSSATLQGGGFNHASHAVDIIINATSTGLQDAAPAIDPSWFAGANLAYDMMYGAQPTAFMRVAQSQGVAAHDGLGMLVGQAAEAFFIWHGVRPDVRPVLQNLRGN